MSPNLSSCELMLVKQNAINHMITGMIHLALVATACDFPKFSIMVYKFEILVYMVTSNTA